MEVNIMEEYVVAGSILIGLVNGFNLAYSKNWESFFKFLVAVVGGAVLGYLQWFGLPSIEAGIGAGLASSGIYKIGQKMGGE